MCLLSEVQIGNRLFPLNVSRCTVLVPETAYVQTIASLPSSVPKAMRAPSGDMRGDWYGPGSSFSGSITPLRSIRASCLDDAETGPGMYTREPVLEKLKWEAPVAFVAPRLTPSTIGTASPMTSRRPASNATANTLPLTAYTICPVGT